MKDFGQMEYEMQSDAAARDRATPAADRARQDGAWSHQADVALELESARARIADLERRITAANDQHESDVAALDERTGRSRRRCGW